MWRFLKRKHSENSDEISDEEPQTPDQFRDSSSSTSVRKKIYLYDGSYLSMAFT